MSTIGPDSEVIASIALRRVQAGAVACVAGLWLDGGRPIPSYLPSALDELTAAGHVTLADDAPHGPLRRAALTGAGRALNAELHAKYGGHLGRTGLDVSAPGPRAIQAPTDHRLSDPQLRRCDDHHRGQRR